VGDTRAVLIVLADAQTSVLRFVDVFISVYGLCLLAYVILSMVRLPYSSAFGRVQRFLDDICAPYLAIFRRFIRPIGVIDLSPLLGFVALYAIDRLLDALIVRIL
jgi:YggT family protein